MFKVLMLIGVLLSNGQMDVSVAIAYDSMEECLKHKSNMHVVESYPKHTIMCVEIINK